MEEMIKNSEYVAQILKVLGHPKRLLLLCLLKDEEKSVGDLEKACQISQSQVSQFLKAMELQGIVSKRKESNFVFYYISDLRIKQIIKQLDRIYCQN
ncbi:MAG: metalloregulator ArsR/SmtB family transcription factor [Bacteriovoracaceae bacterium]|jgi:DNA-binding transcriptional ArsR family regulator|nr:metalloregulator ArsR/SmtB family transcription factor [Bacteriovoracaceae bacterium]